MRQLYLFLLVIITQATYAQQPNWYDEGQREVAYPKRQYFTGIAYGELKSGESVGAAMERLKTAARVEALSTIRIHVENETRSDMHSEERETLDSWAAEIRETFDIKTTTKVDLEIPGMQVEAWKNPVSNEVRAFAYIKKSTLCRQMDKQITAGLTRIETTLDNVQQLISSAQKVQARSVLKKVVPLFQEIETAQHILIAADPSSDAESLQLAETKQLFQRYTRIAAELKNGIYICLRCDATDLNGNRFSALQGEIKGALSSMGVSFVDNASDADWVVSVTATPRQHNAMKTGQFASYFVYIDADVSVTKVATNQVIFEDRLSEKGGHTFGYAEAARDGYKYISPRISEIIKQHIQQ